MDSVPLPDEVVQLQIPGLGRRSPEFDPRSGQTTTILHSHDKIVYKRDVLLKLEQNKILEG